MPGRMGVQQLLQCATQPINYLCPYTCVFMYVSCSTSRPCHAQQDVSFSINYNILLSQTPDHLHDLIQGFALLNYQRGGDSEMVLVYDCLKPFHSVRHIYIMFF